IGAAVNVPMGSDQVAHIALSAPAVQPGAPTATPDPQRWLLRLDGVTGTAAAPLYTIYLNLPPGADPAEHPERRAGTISTFGVHQATRPGGAHDGRGLSFVFDITGAHDALVAAGAWNSTALNLTFVPAAPPASAHPAFAKRLAAAPPPARDLSAGRIEVLVT
ncbi:MAG: hypothetical protein JOZ49_17920, partial [Mycolicibacterium sp.]|nr:hypothetical protein [Mycolicibacterium sp.]